MLYLPLQLKTSNDTAKTKNLLIEKSLIWFELYAQKNKTNKYLLWVIFLFFNSTLTLIIELRNLYLT